MKLLHLPSVLLVAAGLFALPTESQADDHSHYHGNSHYYGGHYSGGHYYGGHYYYGRPYGYPYRYGYYGPSIGFTYYGSPSYGYAPDYGSDDDTAVDVQRALKRRGFYRGEIDGDVGPGTRAAIRAYQSDRNLPVSGRIDGPLLRSLGV